MPLTFFLKEGSGVKIHRGGVFLVLGDGYVVFIWNMQFLYYKIKFKSLSLSFAFPGKNICLFKRVESVVMKILVIYL